MLSFRFLVLPACMVTSNEQQSQVTVFHVPKTHLTTKKDRELVDLVAVAQMHPWDLLSAAVKARIVLSKYLMVLVFVNWLIYSMMN